MIKYEIKDVFKMQENIFNKINFTNKRTTERLLIIFLLMNSIGYSRNTPNNTDIKAKTEVILSDYKYEEVIITLSANRSISNKEIFAFIGDRGEEPLISLDDFMNGIGIPKYELIDNKIKYQINGKTISKKIKTVVLYATIAVELSEVRKLIDLKSLEWDPLSLNLDLKTNKMLPNEYLKDKEDARESLYNKKEEKVIEEKWKVFTPGIMSVGYSMNNIENSYSNLYLNYSNHLLYGNFNIDLSYTHDGNGDEIDINRINWERNVLDERTLSIGDTYLRNDFNIGRSSSIIGVSLLKKNSWDSSMDVGSKSVRGTAPSGSIVELYENGILRDYVDVRGGEYNFAIKTTGGSRTYEIWIYNSDGSIEKKKVSLYGSNELVEAGKFDYEVQAGQDEEFQENLYNAKIYYGLTEDLTIGIGGSSVLSDDYKNISKKTDYLNASFLQRISTKGRWSSLIGGDFVFNGKDTEENFYKVEGQISKNNISNTIGIENYSDLDSDFLTESYDKKFYLRSDFNLLGKNVSLSYEKEKKEDIKELDRYGVSIYGTLIRGKLSTSVDYDYEDISASGLKSYNDNLGASFSYYVSNLKYRNFIETITLDYQISNLNDDTYGIKFYKNKGNNSFDYSLGYRIDGKDSKNNTVELSFSYTFGKAFELRSRTTNTAKETITSFGANTNINFGMDKKLSESSAGGKSNIKGIVYIDKNADGILSEGEERIENISVVNSGTEGLSSKNGYYEIPLVTSKYKQELRVKNKNEDLFGGYIFPEKYAVKTLPGGILEFNIPILEVKTVIGMFDFSRDFYLEDVEDFLENTKINLLNLQTRKETTLKISNETIIEETPQGKYLLSVDYAANNSILKTQNFFIDLSSNEDLEAYLDFRIDKTKNGAYILKLELNDKKLAPEKTDTQKEKLTIINRSKMED